MDRRRGKAALFSHTKIGSATECWLWTGSRNPRYGRLSFQGEPWLVHRLSYEMYNGKIPPGYVVHHRCPNKLCLNPGHLTCITQGKNVKIAAKAGVYRGTKNRNNKLTEGQVFAVKILRQIKNLTLRQISEEMNIPVATIGDITRGRCWSHVVL